jgi:hypothetical protein
VKIQGTAYELIDALHNVGPKYFSPRISELHWNLHRISLGARNQPTWIDITDETEFNLVHSMLIANRLTP